MGLPPAISEPAELSSETACLPRPTAQNTPQTLGKHWENLSQFWVRSESICVCLCVYGKKKGTPHIKDTTLLDFRCKNTNWILFSLSSVDLKNCSILNKKQHNFGVFQILLLEENLKTCMPRGGHIINETNYRLANAKNTLFSSTFTIRILPNQSETPLATQFSQNYSFCKIQ